MEKICVNLYGGKPLFGGREVPQEADILYCDSSDKCSLFKEGKCLNCRSPFGDRCNKGRVERAKGYTSRAAKYHSFRAKYMADETYNKLEYPSAYAAILGDELWLNLTYVYVHKPHKDEDGWRANKWGYIIENSVGMIARNYLHLPLAEANIDFLHKIFSYAPSPVFGSGTIKDYPQKVVPNILADLKKIAPEIYGELIAKYPEHDVEPNYIGRWAYTKTLKNGVELTDCHGNKGILKDGKIYCESFSKGFVPFNGVSATVIVDVSDTDTYKITDNSQWDENTLFR